MIYLFEDAYGNVIQEERFTNAIYQHNEHLIECFVRSKKMEGCSDNTITNYIGYLKIFSNYVGKEYETINVQDIRWFIGKYQSDHIIKNCSMDNLRRVLNSFYNYLEEDDYVIKSPMKKIHKIKEDKIIKNPFSEEEIVEIQDACKTIRETAIIDFLYITGVRVSELCSLNRDDIDFSRKEGKVFGKGAKERIIYFDARAKIHLLKYLKSRKDDNPALFVSSVAPYSRVTKNGIEYLVRSIGLRAKVENCHPHRFRRTLATRMIDRGVPIEQVQIILGHTKIETTLIYAQVNQDNVKMSHSKFA